MAVKEAATLDCACCSEPGNQRDHNEDACSLPPSTAATGQYGDLLVLADGVGGYPGGAEASQQAVHALQALYYAETGPQHPADRLRLSVESVNALVRLKKRQSGQENGYLTTLVAVAAFRDQLWVANVGDSRAYLIQAADKKRRQLTEDHSGHIRLVKAGLLKDTENERTSSTITRAIGLEEDCQVDTYHYTWVPGDCLVLCSDGLLSLPEEEMVSITLESPASTASRRLVQRAIELDGSDNCTAVVSKLLARPEPVKPGTTLHAARPGKTMLAKKPLPAEKRKRGSSPAILLWVLLGLIIGWLTAALLALLWLNQSDLLNLF